MTSLTHPQIFHALAAGLEQLKQAIANNDTPAIADILGAAGNDTAGETASSGVNEFEPKIKQQSPTKQKNLIGTMRI